jgi:hypothetical protein
MAFSTDYYLSSRIGRDAPAQESTARQAQTVTLPYKPKIAELFEKPVVLLPGSRHS